MNRLYSATPQVRKNLPVEIIGFAVNEIFNHRNNLAEIPFEELIYSKNQAIAVGAVFRLTENDLVAKLESLVRIYPNYYQIRETAGNRQLFRLKEIQSSNCSIALLVAVFIFFLYFVIVACLKWFYFVVISVSVTPY